MKRSKNRKPVMKKAFNMVLTAGLLIGLLPATVMAADRGAWTASVSYQVGDTVTYSGKTYTVVQPHTSLNGWEPPNVPALWKETAGGGGNTDTQAPSAPSQLIVGTTTQTSVALSWSASTDNVGVAGYDIYRGTTLVASVSGSTLSYTNTGLTAGTAYTYTVKAKDAAGNVSAASNQVSATTLPGTVADTQAPTAPANLSASGVTTTSATLSWSASTDNVGVTGYDVYRGTTLVASVSGSTLSYTNTGLTAGTAYTYTVKAKDAAGNASAASNQVSVTTLPGTVTDTQAPSAPANLAATAVTSTSVTLSWSASTDNVGVTGYDVYRGTALAASVTGTTATITGLTAGTAYTFTVKAKDAAGNVSAASNALNSTTSTDGGGNNGGSLPKHILTGYWQNFDNNSANVKLANVPSQYDIIALSFGEMDLANPGGVLFTIDPVLSKALGGYSDADLIADIKAKKAQGKKVILSLGGEKGNINLGSASPNVTNFVTSVSGLIEKFGFDGLDIDLEHGLNVANVTSAVRQIQQKVGPGFVLTMAPQTIDMQNNSTSYLQLYSSLKDITTVINTQYYNSGCMLGRDGKCYSQGTVDFLTALTDLALQWVSPSQLGLGLPATPKGAGGGYVAPSVVNDALNCLATGNSCGSYKPVAKYPDIRGAMTWSINWDATSNYTFANTVKPFLTQLP